MRWFFGRRWRLSWVVETNGFIVKVGGWKWEKEEFLHKKEVSLLGQVLYNNESSPNDDALAALVLLKLCRLFSVCHPLWFYYHPKCSCSCFCNCRPKWNLRRATATAGSIVESFIVVRWRRTSCGLRWFFLWAFQVSAARNIIVARGLGTLKYNLCVKTIIKIDFSKVLESLPLGRTRAAQYYTAIEGESGGSGRTMKRKWKVLPHSLRISFL